jgi:hypothetical protein
MGMLTFFPWFTVEEPSSFGKFNLFPHRAGEESSHGIPPMINNILEHYRINPKLKVRE